MVRLTYPSLAFENLTAAIDIVRAGQVIEKRDLFANLVWNIQGPLQAIAFGNPDKTAAVAMLEANADCDADFDERFEEFAWILDCARSQFKKAAAANDVAADANAIDPATILAIVNVVLQLIDAWRKRRQNVQPIPQA